MASDSALTRRVFSPSTPSAPARIDRLTLMLLEPTDDRMIASVESRGL